MSRQIGTEFPAASETGIDRRTLLHLMGASLALAAAGKAEESLAAPLYSAPVNDWRETVGVSPEYATTLDLDGYGRGVVVKTHKGRPIKIEGNSRHSASLGAIDIFAQAEILGLYEPNRSRSCVARGRERPLAQMLRLLDEQAVLLSKARGRGLRILSEPSTSPSLAHFRGRLLKTLPEAQWHHYGAIGNDEAREGALLAFGETVEPVYDLRRADTILTIGADLFSEQPGYLRYARDYQERRRRSSIEFVALPRLYAAEARMTLTGVRADERIVLHPNDLALFVRAIARHLGVIESEAVENDHPVVARAADDLRRAGPRGIVIAGRDQPAAVHALVHAINERLGSRGTTISYLPSMQDNEHASSIRELTEDMAAGAVDHLMILGGNPVFDAPADLEFEQAMRRVPLSIHLGLERNETAVAATWHFPARHALESWGDSRAFDGMVGLRQPVTRPLAEGAVEMVRLLAPLMGSEVEGYSQLRAFWLARLESENEWKNALAAGIIEGQKPTALLPALRPDFDRGWRAPEGRRLTALFTPDPSIWDGRFAHNGWLQELPKPLTKQVWGNAALVAPETAKGFNLSDGELVEIRDGDLACEAPVQVVPGHAPATITLPLGYGRKAAGNLATAIGFDAYRLRRASTPWIANGIEIRKTGRSVALVTTQLHHGMAGRDIVRVVAPENAASVAGSPAPQPSFYPDRPYNGYAWGMGIDLDACIGCNACVIACQAENNVPVVGREEVARGREMHWLRVDRYFAGSPDNPSTYFQPVPCMHCEHAPCEVVCPVNATVHSSEGLNDMVYNRCIGTRTCSNNCPYKVRRFNWYDYAGRDLAVSQAGNPEVSVRPRGVMEKCTYCVQRISAARIAANIENRSIEDGEIRTACQQACPTQAFTFGDVNDPASEVSRWKASPRNYSLLGELGTRPRTTYLARIEDEASGMDAAR